jgi:undecaprenyl-phosphate galactose phosphotransferase/putative colanic acid biosynthesis UDP-glucose lipid carrier transferase
MSKSGFYEFSEIATPRVEITEVLVYWFATGLVLAFIAFLLKVGDAFSRGSFVIFYLLAPIGLLGARKVTKTVLARAISSGRIGRRDTVLIGEFNEMTALKPQDLLAVCGATEINRFVLSREVDCVARNTADRRSVDLVVDFVRRHRCRLFLLALPWSDSARIELVREQIKVLPVAARLLPDLHVRSLTSLTWSTRNRAFAIEIQTSPLSGTQRFAKRVIDIVVSSLALVFFLPVMAFTAVAIKLDSPGPVIFRQIRKGFNGKEFVIFKFRTMTVQENGPAVVQATRDDSRVTPIGGLLRSLSIDELPQLVNVLRGDMSLVGPRPHALAHDNYFETVLRDYAFRHHVKPGITGWAQCNGARGATPSIEHISERVKLDLWYINNWSLWLDIQILIKTFFEVVRKHNAY